MANKFENLTNKMNPKRVARARATAKEIMAEMLLSEIRREKGITQEHLAASLNIKQPSLSKLESQSDMQISTLRRLVEALGGKLEIIAHMPGKDIRLANFADR